MRLLGIVLTLGGVWLLISIIGGVILGRCIAFGMAEDEPKSSSSRCSG